MKPLINSTIAVLFCTLTVTTLAQNRVLTVDNNPGAVAMFKDFHSAYQAAQDGDTILLAGSDTQYVTQTDIIKRLTIVGNGYFLQENRIPGLSSKSAKLYGPGPTGSELIVQFGARQTSANGSTVIGLEMFGVVAMDGVQLTVDRCLLGKAADRLDAGSSNRGRVTIRRCRAESLDLSAAGSSVFNSIVPNGISNLGIGTIAANCIFAANGLIASELSTISSSIIINYGTTAASFASNVKGSVTHCMAVAGGIGHPAEFLPQGLGNINGVQFLDAVFVATGSERVDSYWQLKPGSPAIGKGLDGVDMGAFGGANPYILSGVPSRPRIIRLSVPALVTSRSGLRFEVDAQSF